MISQVTPQIAGLAAQDHALVDIPDAGPRVTDDDYAQARDLGLQLGGGIEQYVESLARLEPADGQDDGVGELGFAGQPPLVEIDGVAHDLDRAPKAPLSQLPGESGAGGAEPVGMAHEVPLQHAGEAHVERARRRQQWRPGREERRLYPEWGVEAADNREAMGQGDAEAAGAELPSFEDVESQAEALEEEEVRHRSGGDLGGEGVGQPGGDARQNSGSQVHDDAVVPEVV